MGHLYVRKATLSLSFPLAFFFSGRNSLYLSRGVQMFIIIALFWEVRKTVQSSLRIGILAMPLCICEK